jgi:cell division protease FtsH
MVTQWGMSDTLGPILFAGTEDHTTPMIRSPEAIAKVDAEIKRLVNESHQMATRILTDNRNQLEDVAKALIEYETLTGEEINQIMRGEKIARPDADADAVAPKPTRSKLPSSKKPEDAASDSDTVH